MIWLAFVLALAGGLILAGTFVTDSLPAWLTGGALVAWLLALVIFVVVAMRDARSEAGSLKGIVKAGFRTVGQFLRDFMP